MGLYLGNKKVSPAIIEKTNRYKLGKPIIDIDWNSDKLRAQANPFLQGYAQYVDIYQNETKIDKYFYFRMSTTSNDMNPFRVNSLSYETDNDFDLSILSAGKYNFKCKSRVDFKEGINYSPLNNRNISHKFEYPDSNLIDDSDFSDSVYYERWNYTNNTTNLKIDGIPMSGSLNYTKYDEGKLLDYNKSIIYDFNLDPSGNGDSDINNFFVVQKTIKSEDSLICPGYYYCNSFAKISFTLDTDTEVKVKYQITKSSSTTPTILICPIDKNYTSFSYSSKLSSPVVSFNTKTDFEEKEYSFGTLSAGEHFYFIEFYNYGNDFRNSWNATITPVFEKIPIGKYLPADITVENSNYPNPVYIYNNQTGEFKIPMTGNITMTAVGSDIAPEPDLYKFDFSSDNRGLIFTGLVNPETTNVIIPSTYRNVSVIGIKENALESNTTITSLVIPDSVTSIGNASFQSCSGLTSVTIGNGVISIGTAAFGDCSGLTSVTIGSSVTSIGSYAFQNCTKLMEINFNGTKAQWNTIKTQGGWRNNSGITTIHCTDGDITL